MTAQQAFKPFDRIPPYRIVQDFLGNDLVNRLLAYAEAMEAEFVPTKVGKREVRFDPEIRVSRVLRDFGGLRDELIVRFEGIQQQAITDLAISPFDLAHCEIELVAHNDGAFYKRHIDTMTGIMDEKTQRVLTAVLYFHSLPKGFNGGQFRLYSFSGEHFIDIEPERDTLVLFPSWAPHEVLPISCLSSAFEQSRFAINCWYRRPNPHRSKAAIDAG